MVCVNSCILMLCVNQFGLYTMSGREGLAIKIMLNLYC